MYSSIFCAHTRGKESWQVKRMSESTNQVAIGEGKIPYRMPLRKKSRTFVGYLYVTFPGIDPIKTRNVSFSKGCWQSPTFGAAGEPVLWKANTTMFMDRVSSNHVATRQTKLRKQLYISGKKLARYASFAWLMDTHIYMYESVTHNTYIHISKGATSFIVC